MLTETEAATATLPCEVEAEGVEVEPEPPPPLADAVESAFERSPATWLSTPPPDEPPPELLPGAPAAEAVVVATELESPAAVRLPAAAVRFRAMVAMTHGLLNLIHTPAP